MGSGAARVRAGADAMTATLVGLAGGLIGKRFEVGSQPLTFGRGEENDIVLATSAASRHHAEVRREAGGYVLYDRGSTNGTWVNGVAVTVRPLVSGDQVTIGDEIFRFDAPSAETAVRPTPGRTGQRAAARAPARRMRVTITGGGPVGLSFAVLLEHLMGAAVAIEVYDGRWMKAGDKITSLHPAAVVDLDGHRRSHQVLKQQGKAQADRSAPGDGDAHAARRRSRRGPLPGPARCRPDGGLHAGSLEPEDLVSDRDLIAGHERARGHRDAVDPRAVGAPAVVEDVPARLAAHLGVMARGRRRSEDDVVLLAPAERERLAPDLEPLADQAARKPDKRRCHRIGSCPHPCRP